MTAAADNLECIESVYGTAYHEAGHAVAMVLMRRGLHEALIETDDERMKATGLAGSCIPTSLRWPRRPSKRRCEDEIMMRFAGPVAEAIFRGYPHAHLHEWMICPGFLSGAKDYGDALAFEIRHREHDLWLMDLWERTVEMVAGAWPAVEALALELIDVCGGFGAPVPGKDARKIVKRALAEVQP